MLPIRLCVYCLLDPAQSAHYTRVWKLISEESSKLESKRFITDVLERLANDFPPGLAKLFFNVFDADASGDIDMEEFVIHMCVMLHGGIYERTMFVFRLFDKDRSGAVSVADVLSLLQVP